MGWNNILVTKQGKLSLRNKQLVFQQSDEEVTLPLEDIASITLETNKAIITTALLSALAERNIAVITCDASHIPNGLMLGFQPHSRQLGMLRKQIDLTERLKKQLWQTIIQKKLANQSITLQTYLGEEHPHLAQLSQRVEYGDKTNIESQAARYYFRHLFSFQFTRQQDSLINSALNYAYAVIRASIARELVAYGFTPALGIHHCSELNAFNLADDLIEPFRAIADLWCLQKILSEIDKTEEKLDLSPKHKQTITRLLQLKVMIGNELHTLQYAITKCVKSLVGAINQRDKKLLILPDPVLPMELKVLS